MIYKIMEDAQSFDTFVENHPFCHFQKTSRWGDFNQKNYGVPYKLLGFYDEKQVLVATAMILFRKTLFGTYLYIPKGPCVDYENQKLTIQVLTLLKEYTLHQNVMYMAIDPNVLRMEREIDGKEVEGGQNNEWITKYIHQNGFVHRGYTYAYDGSFSNRFTLITDLTQDKQELYKGISTLRKRNIKKNAKVGLLTSEATRSELSELSRLEADLGKYKTVIKTQTNFYDHLYDSFQNHLHFYKTNLPMDKYISFLEQKKESQNENERKSAEKLLPIALDLKKKKGDNPIISVGLFLKAGKTTYTNYYFRDHDFDHLSPLDSLIFTGIENAIEEGCDTLDYLGFGGITEANDWDPGYPLYLYKHQWNSIYIEDIGQFEFVLSPIRKKLSTIYTKVKRKIITKLSKK